MELKEKFCIPNSEPDLIEHLRKIINLPDNIIQLDLHFRQDTLLEAEVRFYPSPRIIENDL